MQGIRDIRMQRIWDISILSHFFILLRSIWAVPMDYCFQPLNTKDCKMKATPVFSYYNPGSRCEVEMWRGCPTMNKFDTEFDCSHTCIGRFRIEDSTEESRTIEVTTESDILDECMAPLNKNRCTNRKEVVYTYNNNTCVKAIWRGCPTRNKFTDHKTCTDTCVVKNEADWKAELESATLELILNLEKLIQYFKDKHLELTTQLSTSVSTTASTTFSVYSTASRTVSPVSSTESSPVSSTESSPVSSTESSPVSSTESIPVSSTVHRTTPKNEKDPDDSDAGIDYA